MNTSSAVDSLAALAQETRLNIFRLLVQNAPKGLSAGEIARRLKLPGPTLSFHLNILAATQLIEPQRAFRVLKPDGRFAISDVVARGEVLREIRKSMELWVGCVAGALSETEYREKLAAAGFESVDIEATRVYNVNDAREFLRSSGIDAGEIAAQGQDKFISAFVRAVKPLQVKSCCGPTCCT